MRTRRPSRTATGLLVMAIALGALFAGSGESAPAKMQSAPVASVDAPRHVELGSRGAARPPVLPPASTIASFPPSRVARDARGIEIAQGELLLAVAEHEADAVEARLERELPVRAIERLPRSGLLRARLQDGVGLAEAIERVRAFDGVVDVTVNTILRGTDRRRGRVQARSAFWNLGAIHLHDEALAGAPDGRARYVVALLDSGVAYRAHTHADGVEHGASPSLAPVEIVAPFDAIDHDEHPDDENGHGTFLANLLVGAPGLARGAALMPVRVLDAELIGTEAALIEGLAHARDNGADVINLSLVLDRDYFPTRLLDAAIAEALASGIVIVAAAGNDGEARVRYPAAFPGVIAVGASTPSTPGALAPAAYSSHGAALDVLAPGGDLDADANRDGLPDGILAESFDPASPDRFEPWLYAGTSQAAAHGSAAALRVLANGVAPADVAGRLRTSARGGGFDVRVGGGYLNVAAALARNVELPRIGAQVLVLLTEREGGARSVHATVALLDASAAPVRGATVHARVRGSLDEVLTCTTGERGTCTLEAVASFQQARSVVAIEIEAVVLRSGSCVRPATLMSAAERDAVLAATDGTGFGSSSTVWLVDPRLLSFQVPRALFTYFVSATGEGSALAPTFLAFDETVAGLLRAGETGGGSGESTPLSFLAWRPESFLGSEGTGGVGFGSSSSSWLGPSFTWSYFSWGSPIYSLFGATAGRVVAQ